MMRIEEDLMNAETRPFVLEYEQGRLQGYKEGWEDALKKFNDLFDKATVAS